MHFAALGREGTISITSRFFIPLNYVGLNLPAGRFGWDVRSERRRSPRVRAPSASLPQDPANRRAPRSATRSRPPPTALALADAPVFGIGRFLHPCMTEGMGGEGALARVRQTRRSYTYASSTRRTRTPQKTKPTATEVWSHTHRRAARASSRSVRAIRPSTRDPRCMERRTEGGSAHQSTPKAGTLKRTRNSASGRIRLVCIHFGWTS